MVADLGNLVDEGCFWLVEDVQGSINFETLLICYDEGAGGAQQCKQQFMQHLNLNIILSLYVNIPLHVW